MQVGGGGEGAHRRGPAVHDAAGAAEEPQKEQLGLLQARVTRDGLQHKRLDLVRVVRALPKHVLQQQAVVLVHLCGHDMGCQYLPGPSSKFLHTCGLRFNVRRQHAITMPEAGRATAP